MRKSAGIHDWDLNLPRSTSLLNSRVMVHLNLAPSTILLAIEPQLPTITKRFNGAQLVANTVARLSSSAEHKHIVEEFIRCRSELHNLIKQRDQAYKEKMVASSSKRPVREFHIGDLVMVYQKDSPKLKERWRGPCRVESLGRYKASCHLEQTASGENACYVVPRTDHLSHHISPHLNLHHLTSLFLSQSNGKSKQKSNSNLPVTLENTNRFLSASN